MGTNERGVIHVISLVVFAPALLGDWFLHSSHRQKRLRAHATEAVNSRQEVIENVIKNRQDGSVAPHCLQKTWDIIQRNQ